MTSSYQIISYAEDEKAFLLMLEESDFPEAPSSQQFEIESKYRQAISGDSFSNISFGIVNSNKLQAIVLCYRENHGLTYAGRSLKIITNKDDKRLLTFILVELNRLAKQEKFDNFKISDKDVSQKLSTLGEIAYNLGGLPHVHFEGLIDLRQDEDVIHKNLRKSYKSLVNQGGREINFTVINKDNLDYKAFEAFREFHKKIAGRVTRPIESWNAQYEMIEMGSAELIIGEMDLHGLVSSAFCIDHGNITQYSVAVYDRDLFEKPLGHASVYKSIMRAKERGQDIFSLGLIPQKGTVVDKEYSIGSFKKGFCKKLTCFVEWNIQVNKF